MKEEPDQPSLRLQIILGVGGTIISLGGILSIAFIAMSVIHLGAGEMSMLAGIRILSVFWYVITVLPFAVLGEYWHSQWKKKSFRPKNVAFTSAFVAAILGSTDLLSYIFELLLPPLEAPVQITVFVLSGGLALVISSAIARTRRIRERLNNMYN